MAEEYRNDNGYDEDAYYGDEKKERRGLRIFLIVLALLLIIFGAVYTGVYIYNQYMAKIEDESYSALTTVTQTVTQEHLAENPIDFASLREKNDELYAWLKVPGTKVDYPIVQSKKDDAFYLKHSALDKSWLSSGAIYTEMVNSTDFTDRVTVIYGHNGYSDKMFTTLHRFEDKEFFDQHEHFYIYTPYAKLTYEIVSAFKYDDRHIMNFFTFEYDEVFSEFLAMIQDPETAVRNVRANPGGPLTVNDKIVVLSTCIKNQTSKRYLICGVLISNEKTN